MALFRRGRDPDRDRAAEIWPDPLRTADDAYETGILIGLLGSVRDGIVAKNLKDRGIARGSRDPQSGVRAAGKVVGKRAGSPPRVR